MREIRGLGLMIGIDLREKTGPYLKALMEDHGVLALPAGSTVLRLLPPLTLSEAEIEIAVKAIAAVLPGVEKRPRHVGTKRGTTRQPIRSLRACRGRFGLTNIWVLTRPTSPARTYFLLG